MGVRVFVSTVKVNIKHKILSRVREYDYGTISGMRSTVRHISSNSFMETRHYNKQDIQFHDSYVQSWKRLHPGFYCLRINILRTVELFSATKHQVARHDLRLKASTSVSWISVHSSYLNWPYIFISSCKVESTVTYLANRNFHSSTRRRGKIVQMLAINLKIVSYFWFRTFHQIWLKLQVPSVSHSNNFCCCCHLAKWCCLVFIIKVSMLRSL